MSKAFLALPIPEKPSGDTEINRQGNTTQTIFFFLFHCVLLKMRSINCKNHSIPLKRQTLIPSMGCPSRKDTNIAIIIQKYSEAQRSRIAASYSHSPPHVPRQRGFLHPFLPRP